MKFQGIYKNVKDKSLFILSLQMDKYCRCELTFSKDKRISKQNTRITGAFKINNCSMNYDNMIDDSHALYTNYEWIIWFLTLFREWIVKQLLVHIECWKRQDSIDKNK